MVGMVRLARVNLQLSCAVEVKFILSAFVAYTEIINNSLCCKR